MLNDRVSHREAGFTLLEILIAMFIFAILAMILSAALHNIINLQERTEISADRLREIQFATIFLSRDIEQAVNRPVLNNDGKQEDAFIGTGKSITFTRTGVAAVPGSLQRSNMQRVAYQFNGSVLDHLTWPVLDRAPDTQPLSRVLLGNVSDVRFEYIDDKNKVQKQWPVPGQSKAQPLPHAVRVIMTLSRWGSMSQLYAIPSQPIKQLPAR